MKRIIKIPTTHLEQAAKEFALLYRLDKRQFDYCADYVCGKSHPEIAEERGVTVYAVRMVLVRVKEKTGIKSGSMLRAFFLMYFCFYMEEKLEKLTNEIKELKKEKRN